MFFILENGGIGSQRACSIYLRFVFGELCRSSVRAQMIFGLMLRRSYSSFLGQCTTLWPRN